MVLLLLGSVCILNGESLFRKQNLELVGGIIQYRIAESPMIHHSESVWADSLLLVQGIDYVLDYREGVLEILKPPSVTILKLEYLLVPKHLTLSYQRWQTVARSDSLFNTISRRTKPSWGSDARLDIQGSKTFAITFSDDQAFDLKQSLYINLKGELSKDVNIAAQLSDSESRLTPEGDSKELSSLDQVFVRVYGNTFEIAMGDVEWEYNDTRYINYASKFEGLNAWYRDRHAIQASYSAGSGKSTSLSIPIVDGKQGPYYLRANNYQPGFIVVTGSEEMYVDGSQWERGQDYSIDYAEGSVMFKRLVSSANNVLARFQYTDEYYAQSGYLNSAEVNIAGGIKLRHHFIWQQDDKDSPLLYDFSASDLDSLRAAGDREAWGESIAYVGPGLGNYRRLVSSTGIEYYEYATSSIDSTAAYNIIFSYVGYGQGDYEEYSAGKFVYKGYLQGSWLPLKRLIAPSKQGNLDIDLGYDGDFMKTGIEVLGTVKDHNTLSDKDDGDNQSGILYGYTSLNWETVQIKLDHETRAANTHLFGKYREIQNEYDFSTLDSADSLAQNESNLTLGFRQNLFRQSLLLRYKDIKSLYRQQAMRITTSSPAWGIIPALNLRSTLSQQDYRDSLGTTQNMHYHQGDAQWTINHLNLKMEYLFNQLDKSMFGTRYQKYLPSLAYTKVGNWQTQIAYTGDETKVKFGDWRTTNRSNSITLKQLVNSSNNRLEFDITHREVKQYNSSQTPITRYDLVNLRSSHNLFKQALNLYTTYSLNQTEFFSKIRELQYIGSGLGLYDSTGVAIPEGDYDYIFITSPVGSLSTEISTLLNIYLKPASLVSIDFFKRWQNDTTIILNEQSSSHNDWRSYLFIPDYVFSEDRSIYGKQSLQNNLWLDLMRNHINGNLQIAYDRSLDKRFQTVERSQSLSRALQLDIKGFSAYSTRFQYAYDTSSDSRYQSENKLQSLGITVQRNIAVQTTFQSELKGSVEQGNRQDGTENYRLSSIALSPTFRSVLMQKYRVSASLSITRNFLSGSNYFSFLPTKREGWIPSITTNAVYRLNSFTSLSGEYRFWDYPKQDSRHELKLEFKAEL